MSQDTPSASPSATDRRWMRFRPDSGDATVTVHADGADLAGLVVDESLGNVGIVVSECGQIDAGSSVTIKHCGFPTPAVVRRVRSLDGVCWLLGCEWSKPAPTPKPNKSAQDG